MRGGRAQGSQCPDESAPCAEREVHPSASLCMIPVPRGLMFLAIHDRHSHLHDRFRICGALRAQQFTPSVTALQRSAPHGQHATLT